MAQTVYHRGVAEQVQVAIVGLGLIGGSLALVLRRERPAWRIVGVDVDPGVREQALAEEAVQAADSLDGAALGDCNAVVLCTPAQPLVELVPLVAARMRPGALLTDVCGAKELICSVGAKQARAVFIGAHPMAGTEYRGFVAATPSLFAGCTVAVCPLSGNTDPAARSEAFKLLGEIWSAAGAERLLDVEPAQHDRAVTYASHLPYLAAVAVVDALLSSGEAAPLARELAAGGFRDTTRLAGDGTVGGAAALNRFIPEATRALAGRLRALADRLEMAPEEALRELSAVSDERRQMPLLPAFPPRSR